MIDRFLRRALLLLAPRQGAAFGRLRGAALRAVLSLLLRRLHLRELLALLGPDGPGEATAGALAPLVVRGLRRSPATCLQRALTGYALLRSRGEEVRLVIGVAGDGERLLAHAWLERDGVPLEEPVDPRALYTVAFTHPAAPTPPSPEPRMAPLRANPDVLLTELADGTGVLLHLGTKFYFALNATGVAVWKLLAAAAVDGPEPLARELSRRFAGATPERILPDVEALLAELRSESLVLDEPATP